MYLSEMPGRVRLRHRGPRRGFRDPLCLGEEEGGIDCEAPRVGMGSPARQILRAPAEEDEVRLGVFSSTEAMPKARAHTAVCHSSALFQASLSEPGMLGPSCQAGPLSNGRVPHGKAELYKPLRAMVQPQVTAGNQT